MAEVKINVDSNIQPNSHTYKSGNKMENTKEKLKPVVGKSGIASTKKSLGRKFADTFIKEDVKDVKEYILFDILIPGAKKLVLDGLSMIFFGETKNWDNRRRGGSRYDYAGRFRGGYNYRSSRDRDDFYQEDDELDYRSIVLRNRNEAEDVVDQLRGRIKMFGEASVADLFDLIDVAADYTYNNYGWKSERDISVRRVSDGFLIDVARAEYLD